MKTKKSVYKTKWTEKHDRVMTVEDCGVTVELTGWDWGEVSLEKHNGRVIGVRVEKTN